MRNVFLVVLTATVFVLTAATLWLTRGPDTTEVNAGKELAGMEPAAGGATTGEAAIGGAFTLTDQNGKTVTAADLKGKYSLIFFGFTHCADICPLSLATITEALNNLGEKADQVTPVFITLDPERDTPKVLKDYVGNFYPSFLGLTGTPEQVKQAADAYKVYYAKNDADKDGNYTVDHSGYIYLMDETGKYVNHFRYNDSPATLTAAIRPFLH